MTSQNRIAASYARAAVKGNATAQQHQSNIAAAALQGFDVPPEYRFTDDGVSGVARRPALERLIEEVSAPNSTIARVYVTDRTRLSRDLMEMTRLITSLPVAVIESKSGSPAFPLPPGSGADQGGQDV